MIKEAACKISGLQPPWGIKFFFCLRSILQGGKEAASSTPKYLKFNGGDRSPDLQIILGIVVSFWFLDGVKMNFNSCWEIILKNISYGNFAFFRRWATAPFADRVVLLFKDLLSFVYFFKILCHVNIHLFFIQSIFSFHSLVIILFLLNICHCLYLPYLSN